MEHLFALDSREGFTSQEQEAYEAEAEALEECEFDLGGEA